MARSFSGDVGAFLPTTPIFDESRISEINVNSQEFKEFLVTLIQTINNICLITNIKDTGYYYPGFEFVTGSVYFPDPALNSTTGQSPVGRQVVRTPVNFGALPNATTKSVAHGISIADPRSAVRIYAGATNPSTGWIPVPFSSPTLNQNIKIDIDATNVNVTTAIDYSAYTKCYVVLEYLTS